MGHEAGLGRRVGTVLRWPVGVGLTSWRYLWRTTPLHRVDEVGGSEDLAPPLAPAVDDEAVQRLDDGLGPVFHRRYAVRVAHPRRTAEGVIDAIARDPNAPAPVVAVFRKTGGREERLRVGDEYVVRMPGPWDGPVRVVARTPTSIRLATLRGHLEAGQIEFRARDEADGLAFEIEAWTAGGDWLSRVLYQRVRLVKEMQLHMWTHYCERVGRLAGGRLRGGVHIHTRRYDRPPAGDPGSG